MRLLATLLAVTMLNPLEFIQQLLTPAGFAGVSSVVPATSILVA